MSSTVWTPPENPNPSTILDSAVFDTRDGQYEQALTKFLWFHNNALRYEPGLFGVRLSFALGYWLDLAKVYHPARDAFIRTRNETEEAFRRQLPDFYLFQEVAAMNNRLNDGIRTAELFAAVADADYTNAQRLYRVAEPYLIAAGRFHACAPFLEPKGRIKRAAQSYRVSKQHEESIPDCGFPIPKLARSHYVRNVATLVGLLVLNDRVDDARTAYDDALATINDDEFRTIMDAAMTGHLPEGRRR